MALHTMNQVSKTCPCGSHNPYAQCCQPLHLGTAKATAAEALMRSRFSAFYLAAEGQTALCEYLVNSWHHSQYADKKQALHDLLKSCQQQQWHSLKIVNTEAGGKMDTTGTVQFVAFFTSSDNETVQQLHEKSHFIKENGLWFYRNGSFQADIKLQRNDTCWCGSGKKFKKCHG